MKSKVNVGVIGFGTIGSSVVKLLLERRRFFRERTGIELNLSMVCDKDLKSRRDVNVPKVMLTKDADRVINDPEIDIVIELIGGIHPAKEIIIKSLCAGKHVVTANKYLLAAEGNDIFKQAEENKRQILFEASVAGGVPIVKAIREGMVANSFSSIFGILNGTSNYILSRMSTEGSSFKSVLKEAQSKGYAEKDSSLDIKGLDSAHKLAILSFLAFGKRVSMDDIHVEGIEKISSIDIQYAAELGYVVKLLAIAKRYGRELEVRVHPTLLPSDNLLSSVSGIYNAIFIDADLVGKQVFYGEGAGRLPTASAILSDIMGLAYTICYCNESNKYVAPDRAEIKKIRKMDDVRARYYVHFSAIDKPGVLAQIADLLGRHGISISSVVQKERRADQIIPIVMLTHEAREKDMQDALKKIDKLKTIKRKSVLMRLER
ncbi:MAG: homoserine dehydrogenase [Candidatus Omnitrophica bacterium]|nr:homoserine dehydrogenase [Candidatus Omnitrophota bacterium]MBU1932924.1 homoserine dehydrogenase [Candidatus Omnitrophota bacterium]